MQLRAKTLSDVSKSAIVSAGEVTFGLDDTRLEPQRLL